MKAKANFVMFLKKRRQLIAQRFIKRFEHLWLKNVVDIPLLLQQRHHQQQLQTIPATTVAIFFELEYIKQSAVTEYSFKTFCLLPDKFHIFTRFSNSVRSQEVLESIAKNLNIPRQNLCVFDENNYAEMDKQFNYKANIFILGNSLFSEKTFELAINMYDHRERNFLYLHDGLYINLLFAWIIKNNYSWKDFVHYYYPHVNPAQGLRAEDLLKKNVHMINPVLQLTGCTQVIVNADNCIPIIKNDINLQQFKCIKAYLPIPDYRQVKPVSYNDSDSFIVAHFGIPNEFKRIDVLINAIELLRQQKHNVKLLLAGYGVGAFVKTLPESVRRFIIFEDSPDSNRMLSLMKGADLTVQLRWPVMGQASGVVSELHGLGLKCITTKGFVNEYFKDYVIELAAPTSPEKLAEAILSNYGRMRISSKEHGELLNKFSCLASANLIFNRVTGAPDETKEMRENVAEVIPTTQTKIEIKTERKLRILYGASHRILRFEEVPLFIEAGFEVIPVKAHWEIFKLQEPDVDNPAHSLYPKWRETCSVPDDIIEKIQAIDILKYQNLNAQSGIVSHSEAELINEWIDIIYIPNLLPTVPRVLTWFEGLTLFRIYGEGKIMTYDEWAVNSGAALNLLRKYDNRYVAMLMLYSLNGPEHKNILGSNVFHVGPCVTRNRLIGKWKAESSSRICNTALSYIYENPHWTEMYDEFCKLFKDMPLRILGKNNKEHATLKYDERVTGIINNDAEYLELLTDCRCLIDPGTSPFHTHYTPLDAIMMGIPVIFLENSGMAYEIFRVIPKSELIDCGICKDFNEAKEVIQRCLDDINYAKEISAKQKIIADTMFSPQSVLKQIKEFAAKAPALVAKARNSYPPTEMSDLISLAVVKRSFSQRLVSILKSVTINTTLLAINIIRQIYKLICPAKYHKDVAGFLFKSSYPRTYAIMQNLRKQLENEYE